MMLGEALEIEKLSAPRAAGLRGRDAQTRNRRRLTFNSARGTMRYATDVGGTCAPTGGVVSPEAEKPWEPAKHEDRARHATIGLVCAPATREERARQSLRAGKDARARAQPPARGRLAYAVFTVSGVGFSRRRLLHLHYSNVVDARSPPDPFEPRGYLRRAARAARGPSAHAGGMAALLGARATGSDDAGRVGTAASASRRTAGASSGRGRRRLAGRRGLRGVDRGGHVRAARGRGVPECLRLEPEPLTHAAGVKTAGPPRSPTQTSRASRPRLLSMRPSIFEHEARL